jgi:hypothetical protein
MGRMSRGRAGCSFQPRHPKPGKHVGTPGLGSSEFLRELVVRILQVFRIAKSGSARGPRAAIGGTDRTVMPPGHQALMIGTCGPLPGPMRTRRLCCQRHTITRGAASDRHRHPTGADHLPGHRARHGRRSGVGHRRH